MTLIANQGTDGARVHVLAIGVGEYRHLPGGTHPATFDTIVRTQLSSPPLSLDAFVEWSRTMRHPTAQAGTVEVLGSPMRTYQSDQGQPVTTDLPTLANVKAAFDAWYERCDQDKGSVAIFYFCGHGVEKDVQYLLLEDYGAYDIRLLENALDFDTLQQGMARCKAASQYFLIDACREVPFGLLERMRGSAEVLIEPDFSGDPRTDLGVLRATRFGARAFAVPGAPTLFTQALMRALTGLGARPTPARQWNVTFSGVGEAITTLLAGQDADQQPTSEGHGPGVLHVLDREPLVPIKVAWDPSTATDRACIALAGQGPHRQQYTRDAAVGAWSTEVAADSYQVNINFPDGQYEPANDALVAYPPAAECVTVVH